LEIKTFEPKKVAAWALPMHEVRILPLSDIQYGAQGCDVDRLKRHVDWGLQNDCHFIGLGDYLDVASPSNRRMLREITLYDSVREMMDNKMDDELKKLLRILEPTKGRWLGLVSGHHLWEFADGTTTDTRLAAALDTHYMGDGAAVSILQFKHQHAGTKRTRNGTAKIWFHHGQGGGQTAGSPLNRLEHIAKTFYADVYLMAHQHRKVSTKMPFIDYEAGPRGGIHFTSRNRILACTGGFLKGYEMGTTNPFGHPASSYVEKAMMTPTALGGVLVFVRPRILSGRVTIDVDISL
jgi:hypothetical protein